MAKPKPLMTKSSGPDDGAVQSALRTLDAEASGVAALSAALKSDLGTAFVAAAELIRNAKGRLIVTGLGGLVWMSIGAFIMAKMVSFEI